MRYALAALLLATQLSASTLEPRLTQELDRLDALLRSASSAAVPQAMIEGNRTLLARARSVVAGSAGSVSSSVAIHPSIRTAFSVLGPRF